MTATPDSKTIRVKYDADLYPSNGEPFEYATDGSAGFDIRSINSKFTLNPGGRALVSTGLRVALPDGIELQIRSRSGLALKQGLIVLNAPGTIDCDYRGEVGVILINLGDAPVEINHGDRIAQGVFAQYKVGEGYPVRAEEMDRTNRSGGFGSTGVG